MSSIRFIIASTRYKDSMSSNQNPKLDIVTFFMLTESFLAIKSLLKILSLKQQCQYFDLFDFL